MKYTALLRGINVGGNHIVPMAKLKALFESLGYTNTSTYINSGNVFFESEADIKTLLKNVSAGLNKEFNFEIPLLINTEETIKTIAAAIPPEWKNDSTQKSDVAYLFPEIDTATTLNDLPFQTEFIDMRYVKGAIIWNVDRNNYNKSHLNKIVGHRLYRYMTVRNVNTARYLAGNI